MEGERKDGRSGARRGREEKGRVKRKGGGERRRRNRKGGGRRGKGTELNRGFDPLRRLLHLVNLLSLASAPSDRSPVLPSSLSPIPLSLSLLSSPLPLPSLSYFFSPFLLFSLSFPSPSFSPSPLFFQFSISLPSPILILPLPSLLSFLLPTLLFLLFPLSCLPSSLSPLKEFRITSLMLNSWPKDHFRGRG